LYVNGIIIAGSNMFKIEQIISFLKKEFEVEDIGELSYILGLKIDYDKSSGKLFINQ